MSEFNLKDMELPGDDPDPNAHPGDGKDDHRHVKTSDMSLTGITGVDLNRKVCQQLGDKILEGEGYDKLRAVSASEWTWDKKPISDMTDDEVEITLQKLKESGLDVY